MLCADYTSLLIKNTFLCEAAPKHTGFISCLSVKPSMHEISALGAAMAAGAAEGVGVWSLKPEDLTAVTYERFEPRISSEGKEETDTWS